MNETAGVDWFFYMSRWETAVSATLVVALVLAVIILAVRCRKQGTKSGRTLSEVQIPKTIRMSEHHVSIAKVHNIGAREIQQDCVAVSRLDDVSLAEKKGVLAVVADGMGGLEDGDKISLQVAMSMLKSFGGESVSGDPGRELLVALSKANEDVNSYLGEVNYRRSGSTLVAVNIRCGQLWWLTVGDSHLFLMRSGALIELNHGHNFGAELDIDAVNGLVGFDTAAADKTRDHLTSFLGMGRLKYVDRNTCPTALLPGDRVILASDGITEALEFSEITQTQQKDVEESARLLEAAVLAKRLPHQDNFSAVIMEYR